MPILVLQYRAYIYSSPTVVDLDGDGMLEVSMQQPQCATVATVATQSGLCNAACSREHPCHCCCTPASPYRYRFEVPSTRTCGPTITRHDPED